MRAPIIGIILTLVAAAAVYLAGNSRVQLWDRDEPRYAECSRQMLESGDWVVPRLYDRLRFQKPPLIYWCQASAMKLLGSEGGAGAFAARLPSVVAMLLTLTILAIAISKSAGIEQAAWTVFVMATPVMTLMAAKTCLTDSVLLLFIVVAQLCLYTIWRGNRSWTVVIIMAVAVGLGGLTKGPFILGIIATTALALGAFRIFGNIVTRPSRPCESLTGANDVNTPIDAAGTEKSQSRAGIVRRDGGDAVTQVGGQCPPYAIAKLIAKILVGLMVVAVLVAPWFYLIQHRAPDFLPAMLHEGRQHTLEGKEGHHFPPGYHLLLVWPMFMPWSLLLPMGIGVGIHHRKIPQVRFALAAALGPWLMVEFMGTKLPHYLLPAYPAMAFLVANAICDCLRLPKFDSEDANSRGLYPRRDKRGAAPDPAPHGLASRPFLIAATCWALVVACIGVLPWLAAGSIHIGKFRYDLNFRDLPTTGMVALTVLGIIFSAGVFIFLYRRVFAAAFISMGTGMLATVAVAYIFYFPGADFLRVSTHVADVLQRIGATHPGDVEMLDYKEPSLGFYQGGTIRETEITVGRHHWAHWVVLTRENWDALPPEWRAQFRIVDSHRGWSYSDRGKVVDVMVVENSVY